MDQVRVNPSELYSQRVDAAYCDGGVVGASRSFVGGMWAWCHVAVTPEGEYMVAGGAGFVKPNPRQTSITNNYTEYVAAVRCLQALPAGWEGTLYCDSRITLGRLFSRWQLVGIPEALYRRAEEALARLGTVTPVLLDGHPTKAELANGYSAVAGRPVSRWNVWCDEACRTAGREYMASLPQLALSEAESHVEARMGAGGYVDKG